MTGAKRLTVAGIKRLRAPKTGRLEVRDSVVPGLTLRVTANDRRTFTLVYRLAGQRKLRRMTLGNAAVVKLDAARDLARDALLLAEDGIDPAHERQERRETESVTFGEVADDYLKRHVARLRTPKKVEGVFDNHILPEWRDRSLARLKRRDVKELVRDIHDDIGHGAAREVLKHVRGCLTWAVDEEELIDHNVALGVKPPTMAAPRERTLTPDEIKAIWRACGEVGTFGDLVRVLLLTACRRNEIAKSEWSWLTLDGDDAILEIPASAHKSKRGHVVPLVPAVVDIFNALPHPDDAVFAFGRGGSQGFSGFSKATKRLVEASGIKDWWLHDLRRTAASGMARLGVDSFVIDRVLGHNLPTLRGTYNLHDYGPQKREALQLWADHVAVLVSDNEKVVALNASGSRRKARG